MEHSLPVDSLKLYTKTSESSQTLNASHLKNPFIYYVNADSATERKIHMEKQVSFVIPHKKYLLKYTVNILKMYCTSTVDDA